jgi:ATP-dependent Zn protease
VDYPLEEREIIATHEAGHATVAYLVGKGRRLEVLSIIKRKDALGLLAHRDIEERFNRGAMEMRSFIQIAFGGMVAEELFFGESGSGPAGDLVGATQTAAMMVGAYGLGGSLVSFEALDDGVLRGNLVSKVLRDERARELVDRLLHDTKREVGHLLDEHRYLVEALRDALLDREELLDQEIIEVLRRAEARALDNGRVVVDLRPENGRVTPRHDEVDFPVDPEGWSD